MSQNTKSTTNKRKQGQRRYDCNIRYCKEKGRILARLGEDIVFTYCPKHRKKGERALNFLINSLMRYKLTNFLQDSKQQIFKENKPEMCQNCKHKFATFVNDQIIKLDEMEQTMPLDQVDVNAPNDLVDDE